MQNKCDREKKNKCAIEMGNFLCNYIVGGTYVKLIHDGLISSNKASAYLQKRKETYLFLMNLVK